MKRIIVAVLALNMLVLSGCSSRVASSIREPDELDLIRTIGIDKHEDGYSVTIDTGVGLNNSAPHIRNGKGPTIDSALNVLKKMVGRLEPFYSHTDNVIIGEDLAREGIDEVMDYIARNSEIRIDTNLFVAKGMTAEDLITGSVSKMQAAAGILNLLSIQVSTLGQGYVFTCLDVIASLAQSGKALVLAIELTEGDNLLDTEEKRLLPNGFGIIQNGKLTSYVSAKNAPSVTLLINELDYLNIQVETEEGTVGLGVINSYVDIKPVFLDNQLSKLKIKVKMEASITEVGGPMDIKSEKKRQELGLAVSEKILANLQDTLMNSKELGVDYIGLGQKAEIKAPIKFQNMSEPWHELFPELPIEIEVTTKIKRSFDLVQPVDLSKR